MKKYFIAGLIAFATLSGTILGFAYPSQTLKSIQSFFTMETTKIDFSILSKEYIQDHEAIHISLKIPRVEGLANKEIEEQINRTFETDAMNFKGIIEKSAKTALHESQKGNWAFQPYSAISSFKVHYQKNDLLSIVVTYDEYTGGAHGIANNVSYNFDLETGQRILLKDIFIENVNYMEALNRFILQEISNNKDQYFQDDSGKFKGIDEEQPFYFEKGTIIVYFGLYEIAPYAAGIPEFKIPITTLEKLLKGKYPRL